MAIELPSTRMNTLAAAWSAFLPLTETDWREARKAPDACDFMTGDPQEGPLAGYVETLQQNLIPERHDWFGYHQGNPEAAEAAAKSLREWCGVPFEPQDIALTNGGFGALAASIRAATDPGDEIIFNLPPWFAYEAMVRDAGAVPVTVHIDRETFDLDLAAIADAITPRTRAVIVNTPHNPTGKIYPPETLERLALLLDEASTRYGRAIYIISDEPYNRIVFDGKRSYTPAEFYPRTFLCYSYGKVLLAPGERIGYAALPPTMPERKQMRMALTLAQASSGYLIPNTVMMYALPELERMSLDVEHLQQKRDLLVDELRAIGYSVHRPEATFYLTPESPIDDDWSFARMLAEEHVYTMPGSMFSLPGYFRLSLTANDQMIERSIPRFKAAFERALQEAVRDAASSGCRN
ncbi:MAG: aminotransferase class I/II-fold pyridoxal phosphate-dependent enzyme [Thermomicrobiales bacterium]